MIARRRARASTVGRAHATGGDTGGVAVGGAESRSGFLREQSARKHCMSSHHVACTRVRSFTRSVSAGVGHFNGARRRTGQFACPMGGAQYQ